MIQYRAAFGHAWYGFKRYLWDALHCCSLFYFFMKDTGMLTRNMKKSLVLACIRTDISIYSIEHGSAVHT